jgi:protein arginine N-methyltransferase 2
LKNSKLEFLTDRIIDEDGIIIMMSWEDSMMKKHAEIICRNGGDILEIGFGMGISAAHIQNQDIKSHTIIEIHPEVARRARKWAKDKPAVIIIEGDWYDVIDDLKTYDGIFYDAELDPNMRKFCKCATEKLLKKDGIFSFFNTITEEMFTNRYINFRNNILKRYFIKNNNVKYETMDINPPDVSEIYIPSTVNEYNVPFIVNK